MYSNITLNESVTVASVLKQNAARAPLGDISNYHLKQWNNINFHQVDSPRGSFNKKSCVRVSPRSCETETQKFTPITSIYRELIENRRNHLMKNLFNDKDQVAEDKKSPSKIPLVRLDQFRSSAPKSIHCYAATKKSPSKIPVKISNGRPSVSPNSTVNKRTPPPKPIRKSKLSPKASSGFVAINSTHQMITEVGQKNSDQSTYELVETPRRDSQNTADELSTIEMSPLGSISSFHQSPELKKNYFNRHDVVRRNLNINTKKPKMVDNHEQSECLKCVHSTMLNSTNHVFLEEEKKSDFVNMNGVPISPIRKDLSEKHSEKSSSSTLPKSSESSNYRITTDTEHSSGLPNLNAVERKDNFDAIIDYGDNTYAIPNRIDGTYSVIVNVTEAFFRLKKEADKQCCIMKQASKALDYCRKYKVVNLRAMIEAEKIMLLASTKYDIMLTEMRENLGKVQNSVKNVRSIKIGALIINLKTQRKEKEWFIAVMSHREQVFNTKMIEVLPHQKHLIFDEEFTFTNVTAGFKIKIDIYSYSVKYAGKKAFINKSISSFLKKSRDLFSKDSQVNTKVSKIVESSFKLSASLEVSVENINNKVSNTFTKVDSNSSIVGDLKVDAQITNLKMEIFKRGYVNVCVSSKYGMVWNRRWGIVTSNEIKFWNCSSEENTVAPALTITLSPRGIKVLESTRNECSKPKTLVMHTENGDKYFLNADTTYEMMDWKLQIDLAVQALEKGQFLKNQRCIN